MFHGAPLVLMDGTPADAAAIRFAAEQARTLGTPLYALRVHRDCSRDDLLRLTPFQYQAGAVRHDEEERRDTSRYVADVLHDGAGLDVRGLALSDVSAYELNATARELGVGFFVSSRHFGSHCDGRACALTRESRFPVVSIPTDVA